MFVIVGSVNFKEHLEDEQLPPSYSSPMYPELYNTAEIAENRIFQKVIERPDKYNKKLHRVENYKGTSNIVLLDEQNKVKCLYGFDNIYQSLFGYVETEYGYITYRLLEI